MAFISRTDKLPVEGRQYFMHSEGYVLLRIIERPEEKACVVMTATAAEDHPWLPPKPREDETPSILQRADETPDQRPAPPCIPDQVRKTILCKEYPDQHALIAAAMGSLGTLGGVQSKVDNWGRPYVFVEFPRDDRALRRAANSVARALELEEVKETFGLEDMQNVFDDLDVGDERGYYLGDGMWMKPDGDIV